LLLLKAWVSLIEISPQVGQLVALYCAFLAGF
jgi:hypothetical protein